MEPNPHPPGLGPSRAKVLIVDDDERNAFAAVQALETLGHELVVARSGEEALRCVLADEFAVILLDLHMPGMDGYETAALLRSRKRTRDTPIVFLTAVFRDEAHLFKAYSAGAIDVVFKPVDPFILRSKVSLLVELRLKTEALRLEAENRLKLLDENARIYADKLAAERALRRSRERQESILRSLPIVFHSRGAEPPYAPMFVSDSVLALTGFPPERFIEEPEFGAGRIHPDDAEVVAAAHARALETGVYQCEYRWRRADGTYVYLLDQGVLAPAEPGEPPHIFGTLIDHTERRSLEEQLAHARKMEAVGELTGGVAHDFNNLLTVILGNISLLTRTRLPARQAAHLEAVREAADRGRMLTQQLLAFSRRQRLNPVVIDIGGLIARFSPLIRQAVGEAVTVTLDLHPETHSAFVDPIQLESALLNLAVNARDAMSGAGVLTISTRLASGQEAPGAGDWIEIRVTDTGVGMEEEVRKRVFEPFFTTKEVGKGSGLGLSQVYGFVRQSGGHVEIDSAPGQGASFRLWLEAQLAQPQETAAPETGRPAAGGMETILVVEDDAAVLKIAVQLLKRLGYKVLTAQDGQAALSKLAREPSVDLLFSDVVMPGGLSGVDLARQAQTLRSGLKVLLTSGFIARDGERVTEEFPLIDKPYKPEALAAELRRILDRPAEMEADAQAIA